MLKSTLRSDFILLLAAVIWGFAFVAQRVGMDYVGPFTYTAVRFTLGSLVLLPILLFRKSNAYGNRNPASSEKKKIILLQLILGLILFGGISFQQYGLQYTTAGNAGFITGFYVVLVPVVGIFLGHKNHFTIWIGVILAFAGLYFLSVTREFSVNPGDYFVFICALFWTVHVLLVGYVAPRTDPLRTAVIQFAICALLSWIVAAGLEPIVMRAIVDAAWPILYGGVMSVGIAYTLQIIAQQKAHPAHASIILSLEAVFAVIGGWLLLQEQVTNRIIIGCLLMLAGMMVVQLKRLDKVKS
ncbi:MAG: DMT family transporter [Bacteroidales bacterium]|jgi:drug/metabolite transporter (DMT)-like permease|nr:DMT family transporter [Bacteroidales bacterium]